MLSYQHGYHAGNFADVMKHFTLGRILDYLCKKEKPIFYLDTHSGRGLYDLQATQAVKTGEYLQGIKILWEQKEHLPALFSSYLNVISTVNSTNELRYYPGSPCLAIQTLRKQDRLYCCELHPREFDYLTHLPRQGKRVFYSHHDGLASLISLLPPPESRGLIFIDPSYEIKTDYKEIADIIHSSYRRFARGIYCLWYPIVDKRLHEQLLRKLGGIAPDTLRIEFHLESTKYPGMNSCGLWIINPPYVLIDEMKIALEQLCKVFNPGSSSFFIEGN